MAYDPDWDDEPLPTLKELYRTGNLIEFTSKTKSKVLKPLIDFITFTIKGEPFIRGVFDLEVLDVSFKNLQKILSLMRVCAMELLEKMLNVELKGQVSEEAIWNIAAACLSLSIKLYGAHDWIWSSDILPLIVESARHYRKMDRRISVDPRIINLMERDIMQRTDWKGCSTFYLDRKYDSMFPGLDNEPTESDYKRMSKEGSSLLKNAVGYVELTSRPRGKVEYVIKYKNNYYGVDEVYYLPFTEMHVVVDENFVKGVADSKKKTMEEIFDWMRERVLKNGFGIDPLSFEYKKNLFLLDHRNDQYVLIDMVDDKNYNIENVPSDLKADIVVRRDLVEQVMNGKKIKEEEAMNWLRDRIVKYAFDVEPLSFKYLDQSSYQIRPRRSRRSRKSLRKRRKASRKVSKKTSRKPSRKVSKKESRKSLRKLSKKASRKSPRKSLRKTRKSSRKSLRSSRKK
jgi:hypothetical protein